jgi:biotin carboxylase
MKTFIILQNIVTFRTDWNKLIDREKYAVCLLTGKQGWGNLPADQKPCFDDIQICDPFTTEELAQACRDLFTRRNITNMAEVRIITNDEYFLGHAARLRETFGIQGATFAQTEPFINKLRMKAVIAAGNIDIPLVVPFSPQAYQAAPERYLQQVEQPLSYPIFAKQIDSAGSERIAKIHDRPALRQWCETNKDVENYELDQFIEGTLFHIDSLVYQGKIADIYICQYSHPNAEFIDGKPVGSLPLDKENPLYSRFEAYNSRVFDALGYVPDGATHLEAFLTKDDRIVFLEIAARAPGGWIPQMHALCSGRNIEEQHFLAQMGLLEQANERPAGYAAWVWYPHREGARADIEKNISVGSAYKTTWEVPHGTLLTRPQSVRDRIGGILLWNDSLASLTADFQWLVNDYLPYHDAVAADDGESQ